MRIIGGQFKGRKISPPKRKLPTRPTTDFTRESLFNMLFNWYDFEDIRMLDLFGGFGMNSLEAISRGCQDVVYVDTNRHCLAFVKETAELLDVSQKIQTKSFDIFKSLGQIDGQFNFIFADPPYDHFKVRSLPDMIFKHNLLLDRGTFVLEHNNQCNFSDHPRFSKQKKYGQSILSFFE